MGHINLLYFPFVKHTLDQVLELREWSAYSTLAWLRMPPGLPLNRDRHVYRDRLLRLAREGGHRVPDFAQARSYPRQNSLALALRELGRIERTLFTLEWLRDPALRRRVNAGLNKGEARNSLSRVVFLNRLGEIRDAHSRLSVLKDPFIEVTPSRQITSRIATQIEHQPGDSGGREIGLSDWRSPQSSGKFIFFKSAL